MKKNIVFICFALLFMGCSSETPLYEVSCSKSLIKVSVPEGLHISKEDNSSVTLTGDERFVHCMRTTNAEDKWDLYKFSKSIASSDSRVVCTTFTDTLIAYEVHVGNITIPAQVMSVHQVDTLSIIITTMGYSQSLHERIAQTLGLVSQE